MQASVFNFEIGTSIHSRKKRKYFRRKILKNIYYPDNQLKNKLKK
jgi:hypothetical protein